MSADDDQMVDQEFVNATALEPLFEPWDEPNQHRVKAGKPDKPAKIVKGRRPSPIIIAQNLRSYVRDWREGFYAGASDTTRQLLNYWFNRAHRLTNSKDEEFEFRYYFCQREAIESLIYLLEVRQLRSLSQIIAELGGIDAEIAALGITEEEDAWSKYAFKLATGAGKTKVMSLAMVWSYFHALRESDSPMARHFVVVAPNLTVYERLKEDFGDGKIFDNDPLIPVEWRGDWNMSVVLQAEASGAATGGVLYLTNIHRLYDPEKRSKKDGDTYKWMGPSVSKADALDTGKALRDRITSHRSVMILNDEAHHIWDPDSAWSEAIRHLNDAVKSRTGGGLVAQLDFSATPKDNKGQHFKHIICDAPLGEAVDGGIVKTPLIGRSSKKLSEEPSDDAAYRYERHLRLGYERWKKSKAEWAKSDKKALLFVMCEDTTAADQITRRFNTDPSFVELNDKTINLHTNLKGKIKKVGKGENAQVIFVENEKEISDEDLKALRQLSRELDSNTSPYYCIVSVLMLREGWDVRNVTTIVPLRPYTSKANILPEQTLGRGLRRMSAPGSQGASEVVSVVEHAAFASLYQQELAQEGLPIEIVDIEKVPSTTITIFPDETRKDINALDIVIPSLQGGYRVVPKLEGFTLEDVTSAFKKFKPLPLGGKGQTEVEYEGRHLFTGEVVERMKIHLPLLESGVGAVSYYVRQIEQICNLRGLHAQLAPLIQTFLEDILFERKATLFDEALITRLGDSDVSEHVRAIFVPLIRARTVKESKRLPTGSPIHLSRWKPFQATMSERRPCIEASRTLFNLVSCTLNLEVAVAKYFDKAPDSAAFAKNSGPQCLRIDYLDNNGRLAFYTPDFFVRTKAGVCYLIEAKGNVDEDVPRKARAGIAWCESASSEVAKWEYVYLPQGAFERMSGNTIEELVRTCRPSLKRIVERDTLEARMPLIAALEAMEEARDQVDTIGDLVDVHVVTSLGPRYQKAIEQAVMLYKFFANKEGMNYGPVFNALLGCMDEAARGVIIRRLQPVMPATPSEQKAWFSPYLLFTDSARLNNFDAMGKNLKKTLLYNNGLSPVGLLRTCLDYRLNDPTQMDGVFKAIKDRFEESKSRPLLQLVQRVNDFRNQYVAHQTSELTDAKRALEELKTWIAALKACVDSK